MTSQKTLREHLYGEDKLDNYTLDDIDTPNGFEKSTNPEDWSFVEARTRDRGSQIYSEGIYKIFRSETYQPLIEPGETEWMDPEQIEEKMPDNHEQMNTVPSIRGEYLSISKINGRENENGEVELSTSVSTHIPVEFVIQPLSYDEVKIKLIDEYIK